jgi:hypothetical protein
MTVDAIDITMDRHEMLDVLEGFKAEFAHYCAFADVYDAFRPAGSPRLNPKALESWPEEDTLTALRLKHQEQHGALGLRACKLTEGGYCGLFREGMALARQGGIDGQIAAACALGLRRRVQPHVRRHRQHRHRRTERSRLAAARRAGRGADAAAHPHAHCPVQPAAVGDARRGDIEPVAFDYRRAGLAA